VRKTTYEVWKDQVDAELLRRVGLTSDDLPDYCYRDSYEAGESPRSVAQEVIAALKEDGY